MIHETRAGQQFRQLPMFMTAREIRRDYQALDGDRDTNDWDESETDDDVFDRKYAEAESPWRGDSDLSLTDDILQHGVKNPVSLQADHENTGSLWKPEILGGHHRVAVMETHKPDVLMPVEHFEYIEDARRSLGKKY